MASGLKLPLKQSELTINGCSVEARIYAENPQKNFSPDVGLLHELQYPAENSNYRFETGVDKGDFISVNYDPMIAKVVTHGDDRDSAIKQLRLILSDLKVLFVLIT